MFGDFDATYPEPVFVPGQAVVVRATGKQTLIVEVSLIRFMGTPMAFAYFALNGFTYGAANLEAVPDLQHVGVAPGDVQKGRR